MPASASVSNLLPAPTSNTEETAFVCGMCEVMTRMPLSSTVRWWSPAMAGAGVTMLLDGTGRQSAAGNEDNHSSGRD